MAVLQLASRRVPTEVWRTICHLACRVPGALATSVDSGLEAARIRHCALWDYRSSMATKAAMSLVCRSWYSLCMEVVYEDLRPRSVERLILLIAVLRTKFKLRSTLRCRGWWTKRLDLPYTLERLTQPLLDILPLVPNLRILNVPQFITSHPPHKLSAELFGRLGSLRSLQCHHLDVAAKKTVFLPYLDLELDTLGVTMGHSAPLSPLQQIAHDRITNLTITFQPRRDISLDHCHFPHLRHLTLYQLHPTSMRVTMRFLERHGDNLVSLSLDTRPGYDVLESHLLLQRCKRLQEVVYLSPNIAAIPEEYFFPGITRMGICTGTWPVYGQDYSVQSHFNFPQFPDLECVRVINTTFRGFDSLRGDVWAWFGDRRGIRFEDANGLAIPDVKIRSNIPVKDHLHVK